MQLLAEEKASYLSQGRYDRLVDGYVFPLALSHRQRFSVASPPQVWSFYQSMHAELRAEGMEEVQARVTAVEVPRGNRCRVWTDWLGGPQGQPGKARLFARTICFYSGLATCARVEMLEFAMLTLPGFGASFG